MMKMPYNIKEIAQIHETLENLEKTTSDQNELNLR